MKIDLGKAGRQVIEEYETGAATKITEVKRARLQTWLERGWIVPSIQVGAGPGVRNIFDRNDLYWIAIFKMITEIGLPRKIVGDIIARLKELSGYSLQGIDREGLEYVYHTIFYARKGENTKATLLTGADFEFGSTITELGLSGYDHAFVFNALSVLKKVDQKIEEFTG